MWKEWIAVTTVTRFPYFKTSPNSLSPLFSSSLAYLLFFLALCSHLFFSFFPRSLVIILLLFICYSLNHCSLMSFSLTFFICQFVCLSPHLPFPSFYPVSAGFSFNALITRSACTLANRPITLAPTNLISCFSSRDFVLIIRHIWHCLFIPVWSTACMQICVSMLCLTVCEAYLYACVCKSSCVIIIALGRHYWSELRLWWDKVFNGDKAGGVKGKGEGVNAGSTIPRPARSQAELWALCV